MAAGHTFYTVTVYFSDWVGEWSARAEGGDQWARGAGDTRTAAVTAAMEALDDKIGPPR